MTRTIILFLAIVIAITIPLIVFYIWFPASLGRFTGLVENIIAGIIFGVLITIALDLILRNRQQKSIDKIARVGASEVSAQVNRLTALFAGMVKAASDGFVPNDFTSLFGIESAKLIALHLGLDKNAPVTPRMTWKQYIGNESERIKTELHNILVRYQMYFPSELLTAIAGIYNNQLVNIMRQLPNVTQANRELGIEYPVLNIPIDSLQPLLGNIARCVEVVRSQASRLSAFTQVGFPFDTFRDDVSPKFGDSRYVGKPGPPILIGRRIPPPEQMIQVDGAGWIQELY